METSILLNKPIADLELSDQFKNKCIEMKFGKLEDIVFIRPEKLINTTGFSYSWLKELSEFLDKRGMLYLLQPIPGKMYD